MTKYIPKKVRGSILEQYSSFPILNKDQLISKIEKMTGSMVIRNKALVAFLFLFGCRISEVCKYRSKIKDSDGNYVERKGNPIKKGDVIINEIDDEITITNIRTLKRTKKNKGKIPLKNVSTIISDNIELYTYFKKYYDIVDLDDKPLFNLTRAMCYRILQEVDLFNHYMRHLRSTDLVVNSHLNAQELKQFFNWASSATADNYTHLDTSNILDKMRANKKK